MSPVSSRSVEAYKWLIPTYSRLRKRESLIPWALTRGDFNYFCVRCTPPRIKKKRRKKGNRITKKESEKKKKKQRKKDSKRT